MAPHNGRCTTVADGAQMPPACARIMRTVQWLTRDRPSSASSTWDNASASRNSPTQNAPEHQSMHSKKRRGLDGPGAANAPKTVQSDVPLSARRCKALVSPGAATHVDAAKEVTTLLNLVLPRLCHCLSECCAWGVPWAEADCTIPSCQYQQRQRTSNNGSAPNRRGAGIATTFGEPGSANWKPNTS